MDGPRAPVDQAPAIGTKADHPLGRWHGNGQELSAVRRVLDIFRDRKWLRVDVPFNEYVETAAVVCSVETYLRITQRDGWSAEAYRAWCRRMLAETVFVTPQLSN